MGFHHIARPLYLLLGVACIAVSIGAVVQVGARLWDAHSTLKWPRAQATILKSVVVSNGNDRKWYLPHIEYSYKVGATQFTGASVSYEPAASSLANVEELVHMFPVGASVSIAYDPENPARSLIHPGTSWHTAVPAVVALVTLAGGIFILRDARKNKPKE